VSAKIQTPWRKLADLPTVQKTANCQISHTQLGISFNGLSAAAEPDISNWFVRLGGLLEVAILEEDELSSLPEAQTRAR
jgi:hypothetical protein